MSSVLQFLPFSAAMLYSGGPLHRSQQRQAARKDEFAFAAATGLIAVSNCIVYLSFVL
jgi:hypothetical protein